VDVGAVGGEVVSRAAQPFAVPEGPDHLQGLLHPLDLLTHRRPALSERRLVEGLARAEAEVGPPGEHQLRGRPGLGDQSGVISGPRRSDAGAEDDALGRLRDGAEPDPGVAGLAALPPGLEVVAATDAVEAGLLGRNRLAQKLVGRELLVGTEVQVAHRLPRPRERGSQLVHWTLLPVWVTDKRG
jgi:hypothetical protein